MDCKNDKSNDQQQNDNNEQLRIARNKACLLGLAIMDLQKEEAKEADPEEKTE